MSKILLYVLMIEDNLIQQKINLAYLDRLDSFNVEVLITGELQLALQYIKLIQFDIILLDLHLPDSNGIEGITKLQSVTFTPILVLTGDSMSQENLDEYGIKGYLPKDQLNEKTLNYEIQLTLGTMNIRKKREKLETITAKLQRNIEKLSSNSR